jgi:hypothetical protein
MPPHKGLMRGSGGGRSVVSLQEHLQRELGKLKAGGAPKVVARVAIEAQGRLAGVIETALKALRE